MPKPTELRRCRVVVIWIDWYAYHVARFRGLTSAMPGEVVGIELVGGIGVHAGLKFREELPDDLPIETLLPGKSWRQAGQWTLARMLWRRLSELRPEVVLVPGYYTLPAIAAALWARFHGVPSVLMTESTAHDHVRTPWKETMKAAALRVLFTWAVSGGQAHVDYLRELGFPAGRVRGFYDVVDNGFFAEGTARLRTADQLQHHDAEGYFLYVGRLAEEKNVKTLLRSWISYRRQGGLWSLVLVGDGPEAASLRAEAEASAYAPFVSFPGLKSSRELLPFYAAATCFVLPSTREPWGLVVNEAMASALPVLVSARCGCAPDLVANGKNGFTFEPDNQGLLTTLLLQMEQAGTDERARMGQASLEIIRKFSPEHFGQAIASIAASASGTPRASTLAPHTGGAA